MGMDGACCAVVASARNVSIVQQRSDSCATAAAAVTAAPGASLSVVAGDRPASPPRARASAAENCADRKFGDTHQHMQLQDLVLRRPRALPGASPPPGTHTGGRGGTGLGNRESTARL